MTTQLSIFNILKKFNGNGKVIFDKKDFIFLGLDNFSGIIIKGNLQKKLYNRPTLITYRNNKKEKKETNINDLIKKIKDLTNIDFAFIDGGHSYETTYNDLSELYSAMKNKDKTIVCDDYMDASYITEVKKAVDDFVKKNTLNKQVIKGKSVLIAT